MKRINILGSTGSIGRQALDVIRRMPEDFKVIGLSAHRSVDLLLEQILEFEPKVVAISDQASALTIKDSIPSGVDLLTGPDSPAILASLGSDILLNALVGSVGLSSTITALKAGRVVALANKESMVIAGDIINQLIGTERNRLIPVDSEHSAIFQCLIGEEMSEVERVIITASGGPFRGKKEAELQQVTVEMALSHPKWDMGDKISIDSATLMNKGLELIEAHHLFKLPYDRIGVVVHPESIIHSMVEFKDGSLKGHLGPTDMRIPIQYAFTHPNRFQTPVEKFSPTKSKSLTFEEPDLETFPCLKYAREAGVNGKTFPAVLNGANEVAVGAFLNRKIAFLDIPKIVYNVLAEHNPLNHLNLEALCQADKWARKRAEDEISRLGAAS